jgi:hypothetical protein
VPDDDRFSRFLGRAWAKVLRSLEGHDPIERVSNSVTRALASTLREVHGVPSLAGMAEKMREAAGHEGAFQQVIPAGRHHVPTKIAEQAAAALAATMQRELALVSPAEASMLLSRRVLSDLAYHYGFDRMVQRLLGQSYTVTGLRAIMDEVLAGDQVSALARRFVSRPTGEGLRAPAAQLVVRPTSELLNVNLDEL